MAGGPCGKKPRAIQAPDLGSGGTTNRDIGARSIAATTISAMRVIDEALIEEAGRRLAAAAPDAQVILFGSHARGEADLHSDVDFLVVEPESPMGQRSRFVCTGLCAICGCRQMSSSLVATTPTAGERCAVALSTLLFPRAVYSRDEHEPEPSRRSADSRGRVPRLLAAEDFPGTRPEHVNLLGDLAQRQSPST